MKSLKYIFLLSICSAGTFAANDSVYVEIIGDTVKVWDKQVYENCCAIFIHDVSISNDSITIVEKDTSLNYCRCGCYFDLCATLVGISQGSYRVFIYREYKIIGHGHTPDSLYFIDSTSFTFGGGGSGFATKSYQSQCFNPVSVDNNTFAKIDKFELFDCYPNPFNPSTVISYQLPVNSWVNLKVYNLLGQEVATLVNEKQTAGRYNVSLDGSKLTSGVYFYYLTTGNFIQSKKLILLK